MHDRIGFIAELIESVNAMLEQVEERETIDSDFSIVRQCIEELLSEIESLQEA